METRIKLASNTIPTSHLDRLADWVKSYPRLTKGNLTKEFEDKFSKYLGSKHTLFVNSGSSANLLIAAANLYYGNLRNKKIAVPAVSWSTTLSPFIQMGYEPILVDCDTCRHSDTAQLEGFDSRQPAQESNDTVTVWGY